MNACALSMSPVQFAGHGSAQREITLEKPASLPPTEIVAIAVSAVSEPT